MVAEGAQHFVGFFHGLGFVEHFPVDVDDGIGCYQYFFSHGRLVMHRFVFGQELADFFGRLGVVEILIGLDGDIFKVKTRIAEQLMSAWRLRR